MPGMLTRVTSSIFDEGRLRTLVIGFGTYDFAPGLFAQGTLEHIDIDDENPFITTDGQAIFAHEGTHLRVLALACERYVIPDGCQVIEKKAFANRAELYRVRFARYRHHDRGLRVFYSGAPRALCLRVICASWRTCVFPLS